MQNEMNDSHNILQSADLLGSFTGAGQIVGRYMTHYAGNRAMHDRGN